VVDGVTYTATFATAAGAQEWLVVARRRALGVPAARTHTVEAYALRWLGEFTDTADGIVTSFPRTVGPR